MSGMLVRRSIEGGVVANIDQKTRTLVTKTLQNHVERVDAALAKDAVEGAIEIERFIRCLTAFRDALVLVVANGLAELTEDCGNPDCPAHGIPRRGADRSPH